MNEISGRSKRIVFARINAQSGLFHVQMMHESIDWKSQILLRAGPESSLTDVPITLEAGADVGQRLATLGGRSMTRMCFHVDKISRTFLVLYNRFEVLTCP